MLSCLCRCFITEAISYGCMGRSNTSASTASASGLDGCFDAIIYTYADIRARVARVKRIFRKPESGKERLKWRAFRAAANLSVWLRNGSKADAPSRLDQVRVTPQSGQSAVVFAKADIRDDVNEKERPPCGGLSKAVRDV